METLTIEAKCQAAFAVALIALDHETRAIVTATENGRPWASVRVSPSTDTKRAVFPVNRNGTGGDTERHVSARGALVPSHIDNVNVRGALAVVIDRARNRY